MLQILTIAAFVLPLGLDTFALSTALGAAGVTNRERTRASLMLAAFEGIMPIVGFLVGAGIGRAVSGVADYAAAAVIIAVAIWMLLPTRSEENERRRVLLLTRMRGPALIGLGLTISLDELAVGFGAGLVRLPLPLLIGLIAIQAFVAAQLGMRLAMRFSEEASEWAERVAGLLLLFVGGLLIVERLPMLAQ